MLCSLAALFMLGACAQTPAPNDPAAANDSQRVSGNTIGQKAPGITVQRVPVAAQTSGDNLPPLRPDPDPRFGSQRQPTAAVANRDSIGLDRFSDNPFENQVSENSNSSIRALPSAPAATVARDTGAKHTISRQATPRRPIAAPQTDSNNSERAAFLRDPQPVQPVQRPDQQSAAPARSAPVGIVLGEGDVIDFKMFGQEDMEATAFVSADGKVSLPLIGETEVGGLTPGQAEARITQAYRDGGFFKNPQVNVTLEEFRSQQISVLGEVKTPGRYPLETRTTVLDALALAEGVMATGARVVTVIRKTNAGTEQFQVDLDALVKNAGQNASVTLAAGDIVYVPEAELFYIYGEVRKPDAYAIRPGMTLMQALSLGGGLTDKGSNSRIEIQRRTPSGLTAINPELTDRVQPEDVIFVKERFF